MKFLSEVPGLILEFIECLLCSFVIKTKPKVTSNKTVEFNFVEILRFNFSLGSFSRGDLIDTWFIVEYQLKHPSNFQ